MTSVLKEEKVKLYFIYLFFLLLIFLIRFKHFSNNKKKQTQKQKWSRDPWKFLSCINVFVNLIQYPASELPFKRHLNQDFNQKC